MTSRVDSIRQRYEHTLEQIAQAARTSGRTDSEVRLVVVTKSQPLAVLRDALSAGIRRFGENYPEEAVTKIESLAAESGVEWHMIGHVQSRKARLVVDRFALLHSLDSLKLAQRLDRFAGEQSHTLSVLLEFNVGGEDSKSGWDASDEHRWDQLRPDVEAVLALPNLQVRGLMTMPPLGNEAEASRPYFQRLRQLRDELAQRYPQAEWHELSMGTSADFAVAVEEGASLVRVGTAIVGARQPKPESLP